MHLAFMGQTFVSRQFLRGYTLSSVCLRPIFLRAITWCIGLIIFLGVGLFSFEIALAGPLTDRLATFPEWQIKPPVQPVDGDLTYPDWLTGTWNVTSALVDLAAPLAPNLVSPGFESNRQLLQKPITFQVRFVKQTQQLPLPAQPLVQIRQPTAQKLLQSQFTSVISDRAFNGLNLSRAYLGDKTVLAVKVDPTDPNRQITLFSENRQLTSVITGRAVETPTPDRFITTEVFQQVFRGTAQPYFNEVENTTAYQYLAMGADHSSDRPEIIADQVTAVYLSPQDRQYFEAGNRPVALYRYRLEFFRHQD